MMEVIPIKEVCAELIRFHNDEVARRAKAAFSREAYSTGWHDNRPEGGSARIWTNDLWSHVENYYRRLI